MNHKALIAIAGAACIVSCSPTEYKVERSTVIDAPTELVFEQVNNHKNRDAWSPWEKMDPDMEKSYEGPEAGVGAIYKWSGNDSVGTGTLEIIESVPSDYIKSKLVFTEPWESESTIEWTFKETDAGTEATWSTTGELPGFMFWMGQEDMDEMMGADFEEGLNELKAVSEEMASSAPTLAINEVEVEALPIYYIEDETTISGMESSFFGERYGKLGTYLGADSQNMLEMPLAIYKEWDEENDRAVVAVAMACKSDKGGKGEIQKGMSYSGKALRCDFMGPYEESGQAHYAIDDYMKKNGLEMAGNPWEVYRTDPGMEPDTSKWITEIYYPIM